MICRTFQASAVEASNSPITFFTLVQDAVVARTAIYLTDAEVIWCAHAVDAVSTAVTVFKLWLNFVIMASKLTTAVYQQYLECIILVYNTNSTYVPLIGL